MLWVLNSLSYRFPYQIWKLGNRFNFHRSDHLGFSAPKCGFNGFHGVKSKVFSNQLGFYMLANNQWFPNDQRKIVFCLGYLYGQEISWAKPRIQNVFNWKPMWYSRFTRNFEAMYLTPRRKAKAEKGLQALKKTRDVAQCTHKFNLNACTTKWVHSHPDGSLYSRFGKRRTTCPTVCPSQILYPGKLGKAFYQDWKCDAQNQKHIKYLPHRYWPQH